MYIYRVKNKYMKKYIFCFSLIIASIAGTANDTLRVKSNIDEVSFLLEGALIKSNVKVNIPRGESVLVIEHLPQSIDPTSIRIKTPKSIRVASVEPGINPNTLPPNALDDIRAKRKIIQQKRQKLNNKLKALGEEMTLLKTNYNVKGQETLSKDKLKIIADFYRERMQEIHNTELDVQYTLHDLNKQLTALDDSIEMRQMRKEPFAEITVNINAAKYTNATLQVTSYIPNAGWHATYELLIPSTTEPMKLIHKAVVKQNTSKAWKNVKASVSNTNPTLTNEKPNMRVWYTNQPKPSYGSGKRVIQQMKKTGSIRGRVFDNRSGAIPYANVVLMQNGNQVTGSVTNASGNFKIEHVKPGYYNIKASSVGYQPTSTSRFRVNAGQTSNINLRMQAAVTQLDEIVVAAVEEERPRMRKKTSSKTAPAATTGGTQPKYEITSSSAQGVNTLQQSNRIEYKFDKPYNIPAHNQEKQIELQTTSIPAEFKYYALPDFADAAFLVAKIPGWEKIKLLEGEAAIFFENTWVGSTWLTPKKTTDTLKLSIARDPSIVIKKELIKHEIKRNLLGKNKSETYDYEITVKNTKAYPIEITIEDQIPVSNIKDKSVEIKEKSGAKHNEEKGFLYWDIKLGKGESEQLTLSYTIEK